ncbi:unnamed protein product, partial [Musa banksii]
LISNLASAKSGFKQCTIKLHFHQRIERFVLVRSYQQDHPKQGTVSRSFSSNSVEISIICRARGC